MEQPRLPDLDLNTFTDKQKQVYRDIENGPRGRVAGPLRIWMRNPELAENAQALGQYARFDSSLSPQLSELAILITARYWSAQFEWVHHVPSAREAQISEDIIFAIAYAKRPIFVDASMQTVFDYCAELHRDKEVSDNTYKNAITKLGTAGVIDLTAICGYYTLISMTIKAFRIIDKSDIELPDITLKPNEYFLSG